MKPGPLLLKARTMNEATTAILLIAAIFYGPWLLDCIVREIKIQRSHYA